VSAPYRVLPAPLSSPAQTARARRYDTATSAVQAMGEGIVTAADGRLVAFHERHLSMIERLAALHPKED
jgi:hypothetical protein